jgi:hypothetical protein
MEKKKIDSSFSDAFKGFEMSPEESKEERSAE